MTKQKFQCPHCNQLFDADIPDQLTPQDLQEMLSQLHPQTGSKEDHRHKTADEFFDCPECSLWVQKTATRYQVAGKEQPADQKKEPKSADQPAFGSIFSKGE